MTDDNSFSTFVSKANAKENHTCNRIIVTTNRIKKVDRSHDTHSDHALVQSVTHLHEGYSRRLLTKARTKPFKSTISLRCFTTTHVIKILHNH